MVWFQGYGRLSLAVLVVCSVAAAVEDVKFADLDPTTPGQVVLFYRKGDVASEDVATALAAAEQLVRADAGTKAGDIKFKQCDAAQKENMEGMDAKGLTSLPMLFVAVEGQGTGMPPNLLRLSVEASLPHWQLPLQCSYEANSFALLRVFIFNVPLIL
jgi:hypothetical protein